MLLNGVYFSQIYYFDMFDQSVTLLLVLGIIALSYGELVTSDYFWHHMLKSLRN